MEGGRERKETGRQMERELRGRENLNSLIPYPFISINSRRGVGDCGAELEFPLGCATLLSKTKFSKRRPTIECCRVVC